MPYNLQNLHNSGRLASCSSLASLSIIISGSFPSDDLKHLYLVDQNIVIYDTDWTFDASVWCDKTVLVYTPDWFPLSAFSIEVSGPVLEVGDSWCSHVNNVQAHTCSIIQVMETDCDSVRVQSTASSLALILEQLLKESPTAFCSDVIPSDFDSCTSWTVNCQTAITPDISKIFSFVAEPRTSCTAWSLSGFLSAAAYVADLPLQPFKKFSVVKVCKVSSGASGWPSATLTNTWSVELSKLFVIHRLQILPGHSQQCHDPILFN